MQQGSVNTKEQNDRIVHNFIQGFFDTRTNESKQLKGKNLEFQNMVKTGISQNHDLKRLLSSYKYDPWVQKILISYVTLKIYHCATSWDVEDPQPMSKKNKRHGVDIV